MLFPYPCNVGGLVDLGYNGTMASMREKHTRKLGLRTAAFVAAVGLSCVAVAKPLTYHSPEVGCDWLDAEYARIKPRAATEPNPAVTSEGLGLLFGMLVFAPVIAAGEVFGGGGEEYDFSGDPEDLIAAATDKDCTDLLELMAADGYATGRKAVPRR